MFYFKFGVVYGDNGAIPRKECQVTTSPVVAAAVLTEM